MPEKPDLATTFARLVEIMRPYQDRLVLVKDEPGDYYLNTHRTREDGYRLAFGAVQIKKNYVSYHFMPVYAQPELLEGISDGLKKRMQGKSCWNFKTITDAQLEELSELTRRGFERFGAGGST